jgi:large subunit ribosomal protein L17
MRHQVSGRHLGRTGAHRRALRRNLAASLFEHGTISTTIEKAKFVRPFAERLVTLAKDGSLHARRRAIALLQDRNICEIEDGEPVKVTTVVKKLFEEIGPRFAERNGGYTRIIRLPLRRIGDNGQLAMLQLMGEAVTSSVKTAAPAEQPVVDVTEQTSIETPQQPSTESGDQTPAGKTTVMDEQDQPATEESVDQKKPSGQGQ